MRQWLVAELGPRLDAFVASALGVSVDGRREKKGTRLAVGAVVTAEEIEQRGPVPEHRALTILFEDEHLVAVDKPAGWPSHPLRPLETGTVANALVALVPSCADAATDPREGGLVHRLDHGTTGVLMAAKTPVDYLSLRAAFGEGRVEKVYWALVDGEPQLPSDTVIIDLPLVTRGGTARVEPTNREALPSRTELRVMQSSGGVSLVEAKAQTGRLHQIRAHLAHMGHPLVGDLRYGATPREGLPNEALLHARSLALTHPATGAPLFITAPLPAARLALFQRLLGASLS